jgi:NAD(P)H-flavin reductase
MSKFNFDIKTFGFEKDEVWEHIMFILEENSETEVLNAISVNVSDEKRAHACGRAEMLKDLIRTLNEQRSYALELKKSEIIG